MKSAPVTTEYDERNHDSSMTVTFRGVTVTVALRSAEYAEWTETDPNTVVVSIDTVNDATPLSISINDNSQFEGVV